jgi:transcriptional regulator with XRE-family HTH domain
MAALAKRMTELGIPWDRSIVANLENGRRNLVSVDELLALALVLGVAPNRLILGPEHDSEPVRLAPAVETTANRAWEWACGERAIRPGVHGSPPWRDHVAFMTENRPHAAGDLFAQITEHREALRPVVRAALAALDAGVPGSVLQHAMLAVEQVGELLQEGNDGQD